MFDDDATEFDPNPWGACQRLKPRETFVVAPLALAAPRFSVPVAFAAPPITLRMPALPMRVRRLGRYAIPLFGLVAVLCLAVAYAVKPARIAPLQAASVAIPAVVEPLAPSASGVVAETAPAQIEIAKPAAKIVHKPRARAKRRPIKIDASMTSSPLGHLRPR